MLTNKLLYVVILSFSCLIADNQSSIDRMAYDINIAQSGIKIIAGSYRAGQRLKEQFFPSKEHECIKHTIKQIKTEEELKQCLVTNAFSPKRSNEFPCNCNKVAESFAIIAGFSALESVKKEFVQASEEVATLKVSEIVKNQAGMSTTTKILIGGTVVVVIGGGVFIFAAPVLFPGTVIAAKSTALIAAAKSGAIALGTKVTAMNGIVTSKETIMAVIAGTGEIEQMPLHEQIRIAANIIEVIDLVQPLVFQTPQEELNYLLAMKANQPLLVERIKRAHVL